MASEHHLITKLKGLKLSGMLQSLDMRLSQAQQEHLGYVEFLEILMEDELQRRANQRLTQRVARARFEEIKTLEGFDFGSNPKLPAREIRDLARCEFIEQKQWVLFIGPVGVGKTHLLQAIGHQACRLGHSVLYLKSSRLLADLGGGHADGTWESRFRRYLKPDLLLIDDFAIREFSIQQAEDIYELIDDRSRAGSVMVASNRSPEDWYPLFPNPVLAEGVLDRLINKAHHVVIKGKSYRPRLRPDMARSHQLDPSPAEPMREARQGGGSSRRLGTAFGYACGPPQLPQPPRKGGDRHLGRLELAQSTIGG